MAKYKTAERPLSEIIGERKNFYQSRLNEVFEEVYKSRDFGYIEQFEKVVMALCVRTLQGRLEGILEEAAPVIRGSKTKRDRRSRLTSYQYAKARDEGMTNEEIRQRFRMNSPYQICGFAAGYKKRKEAETKRKKARS